MFHISLLNKVIVDQTPRPRSAKNSQQLHHVTTGSYLKSYSKKTMKKKYHCQNHSRKLNEREEGQSARSLIDVSVKPEVCHPKVITSYWSKKYIL